MRVLIVDNKTIRLNEIRRLLKNESCEVVKPRELDAVDLEEVDIVVLSGSSSYPIFGNEDLYKKEIDLIKEGEKPIIGICLGFELIGYAYGAEFKCLKQKDRKIIEIEITSNNRLFSGLPNFKVYEAHRWVIEKTPSELIELARSSDGVEVVKHRSKNIYGFQFHPEMFVDETCGDEIFGNLVEIIKSQKKS